MVVDIRETRNGRVEGIGVTAEAPKRVCCSSGSPRDGLQLIVVGQDMFQHDSLCDVSVELFSTSDSQVVEVLNDRANCTRYEHLFPLVEVELTWN